MVKTKTKIYDALEEDSMETMVEVVQSTLKELGMELTTKYLDKTLVEIVGEINRTKNSVSI
ncbi:MAG: hypothetical protein GF364_01480, partial [Candidatus Lokiarchaeota archaeon]|nr:hypothetical protein [Candidatus Lokiarchaeota archaeon]